MGLVGIHRKMTFFMVPNLVQGNDYAKDSTVYKRLDYIF